MLKRIKVFVSLIGIMLMVVGALPALTTSADTQAVNLQTSVQSYLSFSITSGASINLGNITPGTPVTGSGGTDTSVTTNAANGYTLAASDNVAGSDSTLANGGTRIADYAGTITTPTSWTGTGLGFSLYSGANKDAKWGTGISYNDSNNKYAGAPQAATTIMSKTGYSGGTDTAGIGWKLDVPGSQQTGAYSGDVTLTVTSVL